MSGNHLMNTTNSAVQAAGFPQRLTASIASAFRTSFRAPRFGAKYQRPLLPSGFASKLFFLVVVFATAVLFTFFDEQITRWALSIALDGSTTRQVFLMITDLGLSSWILVLSGVVALGLGVVLNQSLSFKRRMWWRGVQGDATFVFWSVALSGTSASLIKNTIGRARPRHLEEYGPFAFDFAAFSSGFASFPSGHSTTFGALCMALYLLFPRLGVWLLGAALIGGASRVFVGAHYTSDVVAGLCFGALCTLVIARWLAQRGSVFEFTNGTFPKRKQRAG